MKRKRVAKVELNPNEKKTLAAFPDGEPIALAELAKMAFKGMGNKSTTRGNSWTRNSLRFLVKSKMVKQVGIGLYLKCQTASAKKARIKKQAANSVTTTDSGEK